jgi:hypothetical protein
MNPSFSAQFAANQARFVARARFGRVGTAFAKEGADTSPGRVQVGDKK